MEYLNKKIIFGLLLIGFTIASLCSACLESRPSGTIKRYASVTGLREDKMEAYKQLHAAAWPSVLKRIKECNIQNYSIYLKKIEGKNYLFSYFEYVGDDFDGDMKKMGEDPETQRW